MEKPAVSSRLASSWRLFTAKEQSHNLNTFKATRLLPFSVILLLLPLMLRSVCLIANSHTRSPCLAQLLHVLFKVPGVSVFLRANWDGLSSSRQTRRLALGFGKRTAEARKRTRRRGYSRPDARALERAEQVRGCFGGWGALRACGRAGAPRPRCPSCDFRSRTVCRRARSRGGA